MENNIRLNLITYIAYCLKDKDFSYEKCHQDFESLNISCTVPTLRKEFSLVKKDKLLDFKTHYRRTYPVLTQKGKLAAKTHLPFRRWGDFEKTWKIVAFELPDSRRQDRLKFHQKLLDLGFGRLSRAVYISSHPLFTAVKRTAKKMGIEEYVTFIKTGEIEEEKKKIFRAWNLKKLNEKYRLFMQKARYLSIEKKSFWPIRAKKLEKEFAELYAQDPQLPEKFLPADFCGPEAYGIFKAISNSY